MVLRQQWRSLIAHQRQVLLTIFLGVPVLLISTALFINSWSPSFADYQSYQDTIHTLRSLESQFNQEVLKSRYELFTSYDPIVQNIAQQKTLQTQLGQTRLHFLGPQEQHDIQQILAEWRTALRQKEDLSELFKTQNAQLKNSLRYLPFLTERLEDSFSAAVLVRPGEGRSPSSQSSLQSSQSAQSPSSNQSTGQSTGQSRVQNGSASAPISSQTQALQAQASAAVSPSSASTPSDGINPSMPLGDLAELKNTLNQLIRNVLLYNASADEELADKTEALVQQLTDLENTLEVDSELIPISLFYRHAQIILTTKRYVEDYTEQLLLPLSQYADDLETLLEQAYRQANNRANLYRYFAIAWALSLLILGNVVALQRFRQSDPAFNSYQQKVKALTNVAIGLQRAQTILSFPLHQPIQSTNSQHPHNMDSNEVQTMLSHQHNALLPFLPHRDELGWLAHSLQRWLNSIQENYQMEQAESFSFLTARLSCLTQNRRRLMTYQACAAVRSTLERVLAAYNCELLDVQFESDQMLVLFDYPATVQLASLIKVVKAQTSLELYSAAKAADSTIQNLADIWADAYLIVSCDPPSQPSRTTFVAQALRGSKALTSSVSPLSDPPSAPAAKGIPPQSTPSPAPVPSPTASPPTTIQMIPPQPSEPGK